jgi:tetratricopeptide (TPR) repeat protein
MATDLLVMGTVGRSTLTRLLVGSVTTRVMRALPCSAIAVKAENLIRVHVEECVEDLKARFDQGVELLERGFLEQARQEFEHCLEQAPCYPPAWEQLAIVNEELGNHDEAERCRFHAHDILETMWNQRIEADLKSRIPKKKKPAEMA